MEASYLFLRTRKSAIIGTMSLIVIKKKKKPPVLKKTHTLRVTNSSGKCSIHPNKTTKSELK